MPNGSLFCTKLVVGDLDRMARFYADLFGFSEVARIEAHVGGEPIEEVVLINPEKPKEMLIVFRYLERSAPGSGEVILAFRTREIDKLLKHAVSLGARITVPAEAMPESGYRVAFIADPEGHLVELLQPLKRTVQV